ncbi:MAG: hypothetical protein HQ503_08270 [Rhodospirillales bacterium]|nr:hypothetical protein [Rhodospirillales bacterium]
MLTVARLAAVISPLAIFLALPPFYNGIWVQVEGAVPWIHLVSGIAAAALARLAWSRDAQTLAIIVHPLILIPIMIALLSILLLPWTTLWGLSVFGTPEHGFGALAYLDLAALTAATALAWRARRWRRILIAVVLAATAGAFGLDALFQEEQTWAPFFFSDYLAFYAIFAFVSVASLASERYNGKWIIAVCGVVLLLLLIYSGNKAAVLSFAIAVAMLSLIWKLNDKRWIAAICALFPVLVGVAILSIGPLWQEAMRNSLYETLDFRPFAELVIAAWPSLWSRAMLVTVGFQSLLDQPWRFFTGMGWGHYSEALLANLTLVDGRLHELIGESRVYWDAIRRSDFHSHNQYFEALLSIGGAGLMLTLGYMFAIFRYARDNQLKLSVFFTLILGTLQSFWFQMPHSLPLMAASLAAISLSDQRNTMPNFGDHKRSKLIGAAAALCAGLLFFGFVASQLAADQARIGLDANRNGVKLTPEKSSFGNLFTGLGEIYHAALLQNAYSKMSIEMKKNGSLDTPAVIRFRELLSPVLQNEAEFSSVAATITTVNVLAGLIFKFPRLANSNTLIKIRFIHLTEALLTRLPRRSDLAVPYFNLMLNDGKEMRALRVAERLLARRPNDPIGLWFSGVMLLAHPAKGEEGILRMKRSLNYGIQNQMPVPKELLDRLTN